MGDKIHHGGIADILRHALDHVVQKAAVERAAARGERARQLVAAHDQALKERSNGVECAFDVANRAAGVPLLELGDKAVDCLVHNGGDGGIHIGKVVVEQRTRAASPLGHGRYRKMGHTKLGAHGAHSGEDLATALVARQAFCRAIGCGDGIDHRDICCVVAHVLPPFILFCLTVRLTVLNIVDGSSILFLTQCQQ